MNKIMIREVCDVFDGPHATPKKTTVGPIFLGINAITEDCRLNPQEFSHLSEADYIVWTRRVIPQPGDIVFSYEATLGRYALIPEGFRGCLGRRLAVIRTKSNKILSKWLFYYFQSPEWKGVVLRNTVKGSTVNRISVEDFPDFMIPSVPIHTQIKNSAILDLLDQKIELNNKINDNLTQMARTIFDYWFSQFDFPDKNGMPYRSSGGRMVFCEKLKRYIPLGWEMATLEDVFINVVEPTIPGSHLEGIPYTPIDQIPIRSMSFYGGLDYSQAQSSLIYYDENDIIIGAMRVYFHRVCIAAQKGITRTTTLVLRPKLEDSLSFLFELMNSDSTIEFASKMSVGTQQPYITWDNALSTFCFPKPPKEIIKKYCNEVQVTNQKVISLVKENKILNNLRNWLLPMLMNGQAIVED